jgi:hypothetical protein
MAVDFRQALNLEPNVTEEQVLPMWFVCGASIAAVITLVASCGGDEGASLSAEEFRDRAEAICREVEETNVPPPSGASDFGRYTDEFTAVVEASANEMHELEPPEEFQARWQEYLGVVDDVVSKFKASRVITPLASPSLESQGRGRSGAASFAAARRPIPTHCTTIRPR